MEAIIFSRVSSKDQEEGYSINAQTAKLRQYCLSKQLTIIKDYEVTESSTQGDRKQFNEMLDFVAQTAKENKETVAIVIDKIDRLMRNFRDYPRILDMVEKEICELHFVGENSVINKSSNSFQKMFLQFGIMLAESYINSMKDNVKRSIDYKIKQGEYPSMAPIGYINVPKQPGVQSDIILDQSRCFLVKKLFVEYATGAYTLGDLVAMADKCGLRNKNKKTSKLQRSHIHQIIKDKFYCGIMTYRGKEHSHRYPTLIDEQLYYQCQAVMAENKRKPFKYGKKEFVFRGLIRCAKCGCTYSSDTKKGKYTYLRPTKARGACDCFAVREETAVEQIKEVFKAIHTPHNLVEQIKVYLKQTQQSQQEYQKSIIDSLTKQSKDIQDKLDNVLDLLISKSITQDMYDRKVYELKEKQRDILERLKAHTNADETFYLTLSSLLELTSRAYELFERSDTAKKRKLISLVLTNLRMNGLKLEYSLRVPFNELAKLPDCKVWRDREESNLRPTV